jgi:putative tryptophan/tyrosine transport system ATP-binding protein
MLEMTDIDKTFNPGTVNENKFFQKFSLKIDTGSFVSVVGSNGSGKTTMLNLICGSTELDGGKIIMNGKDITNERDYIRQRRIGRVFQNPAFGTCPDMTILENLALASNKGGKYDLKRCVSDKDRDRFKNMLSPLGLGLEDKLDVRVGSLSGGQRQTLALIMSTMTPIDFLILDEHTAALDPKTAETVMQLTGKIVEEKKLTTVMVTHNLRYALEYGDRILMMHNGQIILDKSGEDKKNLKLDEVLHMFDEISVEAGN